VKQAPLCIYTIGYTENNRISFITLYGLQIFDKERLISVVLEEIFLFRCTLPPFGKQFIDQILLGHAERNHTQAAVRIFLDILINQIHDKLGFLPIGMRFSVENAIHMIIIYADSRSIRFRRRECHQITIIEIFIRERDQLLIAATVMPAQPKLLH